MYYLNILFLVVLSALKAFDGPGKTLASDQPGPWITSNVPADGLITMDNDCKQLLLCYQSNLMLTNGTLKLRRKFRPGKLSTNGNGQFDECAKVIEGKGWHGLLISRDKDGNLSFNSSLGVDGIFSTKQINQMETETMLNITKGELSLPIYNKHYGAQLCKIKVKLRKFSDIDCGRVLANDRAYIEQRTKSSPVTVADPDGAELPMDCESIRARYVHFQYQKNGNRQKRMADAYPLAFIRAVYQDYLFIEMEFATSYVAQNWYCYAIDKKSSSAFHQQIHSLSKCFPNVLVTSTENEFVMDSKGHNYNDDVQMKTNAELVQIFKWMNGVNDIQYTHIGSDHFDLDKNNWHLAHLKLFKNATKNRADLVLQKNKGTSQMSLTRAFVNWLLNELDVSIMLDQLNSYRYGVDEYFIQTLAANEFLDAPGGFTQKCFDKELAPGLTRMTLWMHEVPELCNSGIKRNGICIFGLKDLVPHLNGSNNPFKFANKMRLSADAEAVQCWHEQMFNRTFLYPTMERLNQSFYTELPQVRYNTEKQDGTFNSDAFNCRYKFVDMLKH